MAALDGGAAATSRPARGLRTVFPDAGGHRPSEILDRADWRADCRSSRSAETDLADALAQASAGTRFDLADELPCCGLLC